MITEEQFENNDISKFLIENRERINLIDNVRIDNILFGRFDIIMNRYYKGNMSFMQLVLDFNHISDPFEINIGQIIELPDLSLLEDNTTINDILNTKYIPGINNTTNSNEINKMNAGDNKNLKVTAIPKLKITKTEVQYDSVTGKLIF